MATPPNITCPSLLVKRKTVSNLNSCESFNELNAKRAARRGRRRKKPSCLCGEISASSASDLNVTSAGSDFEGFSPYPVEEEAVIQNSSQDGPSLPLEYADEGKSTSLLCNQVFESLEAENRLLLLGNHISGHTLPSVFKREAKTKVHGSASLPQSCRKYYLSKKEFSLLVSGDQTKNKSILVFDTDKKEAIFQALKSWLSGYVRQQACVDKSLKPNTQGGHKPKDSESSDVLSVADVSSHDSLSDVNAENEACGTKEQEIILSSSSSSSVSEAPEDESPEHDKKEEDDEKFEEMLPAAHKESEPDSQLLEEPPNLLVEDSVVARDSLSSTSSTLDHGIGETNEEDSHEKKVPCFDSEEDEKSLVEATLTSALPTNNMSQDEAVPEEEAPKSPDVIQSSSNKIVEESINLHHKGENMIEENDSKQLRKLDTLDKVQEYITNNPIALEIITNPDADRSSSKKEDSSSNQTTTSGSVSLSSSTSDMAEFEILDLLEENETKVEVPIALVVEKSLEKCNEDRTKGLESKELPKTALSNIRILPRQTSVDSILIRASNSLKGNNTSVWTDKESIGDASVPSPVHEIPYKDGNLASSFDESFMSNYRSCEEKTPRAMTKRPQPPVERRLSYDSLERRMKLRLRARNRWLRQESNPRKSLTRSSSERSSKPPRSPSEDNRSKDDLASLSPTSSFVIIESSPPIETFLTPTAPPKSRQQSLEFDDDSFHTPLGFDPKDLQLGIGPKSFTIPSHELPAMDLDKGKVSPLVPAGKILLDAESAIPPQPASRKVLPSLPKVPHLEAISPTGLAPSSIDRKTKLEEDFKVREARVKERIEKIKAETLRRKKQKSENATPPIDENDPRPGGEATVDHAPTGSGYSPTPTQKHLFKRKQSDVKSARGKGGEQKIKRALPVPHVSGQPLTELQMTHHNVPEERKHHKKHHKDGSLERRPDKHAKPSGGQKDQKTKSFFRIPHRRKHHKDKSAISVDVVDGLTTLERKYDSRSERERAILRGERFRLLPDPPSTAHPSRLDSYESPDEEELTKKYWEHKRRTTAGLTAAQIDAKITRRVQIAARRQAKLEAQKRLRRAQVIQRQLEEVEVKQKDLEERGVILEKMLRSGEEEKEDSKPMQEWFKLVQEKNGLLRYENELMVYQRELQLEDVQSRLQQDLRERMAMDDKRKTSSQLAQEKEILQRMLEVVEQRDELVALLEEQRLKERDESVDPETLMLNRFNLISEDSPRVSARSLKSLA